jgi:hypothetical protein
MSSPLVNVASPPLLASSDPDPLINALTNCSRLLEMYRSAYRSEGFDVGDKLLVPVV